MGNNLLNFQTVFQTLGKFKYEYFLHYPLGIFTCNKYRYCNELINMDLY